MLNPRRRFTETGPALSESAVDGMKATFQPQPDIGQVNSRANTKTDQWSVVTKEFNQSAGQYPGREKTFCVRYVDFDPNCVVASLIYLADMRLSRRGR